MEVKAGASVELVPKGNQIAVNIMLLIAATFFGWAVWLQANDKSWILSLLIGIIFLAIGGGFWWKSQKNESLQQAHPFSLKLGEGQSAVEVSSDARSLPALDYLKGILGQYSAIFHREPLPEPSGTVGSDGQPVDDSIYSARASVNAANSIAQEQSNKVSAEICARLGGLAVASPILEDLLAPDARTDNASSSDPG